MKKKNTKHGKKSTQRGAVDFFLKVDGGELEKPKPIAIWKAPPPPPPPPCFRKANATAKPDQVSYFSNIKSWMQVDIMQNTLEQQ